MRHPTQNDLAHVVGLLMERLAQWGDLLDDPNTPLETVNTTVVASRESPAFRTATRVSQSPLIIHEGVGLKI